VTCTVGHWFISHLIISMTVVRQIFYRITSCQAVTLCQSWRPKTGARWRQGLPDVKHSAGAGCERRMQGARNAWQHGAIVKPCVRRPPIRICASAREQPNPHVSFSKDPIIHGDVHAGERDHWEGERAPRKTRIPNSGARS